MTVRGYPFDTTDPAGSVTELEWRRMFRWLFAGQSGVVFGQENELAVQERAAGANMSVEVLTGQSFAVGNYGRNDATLPLPISDGDGANPRIDLIVFGWDFATNDADIYVIEGEPAGVPVAPSVTQDISSLWEVPLAEVAVATGESSSIQTADITDVRTLVVSAVIDATNGLAAGDVFYRNASGLLVPIPIGSPAQTFIVNAGGDAPEWASSGSSGMELIAENVLGSPTATVTFSAIPATYRNLLVIVQGRTDRANALDRIVCRVNGDSGTNYDQQRIQAVNTTIAAFGAAGQNNAFLAQFTGDSATASRVSSFEVVIPDYAGTTFQKSILERGSSDSGTAATDLYNESWSSLWRNTAAITSITFTSENAANFKTGSSFSLYGLAKA